MAGRVADFGGFAATGFFAQAEDGAAMNNKILFALARIGVGQGH